MCAAPFQLGVKVGGDACCLLQLSQQNIPLLLLQDPVGRFTSMYKKSRVQCMASHISRQACVTAHCVLILQDKLGYEGTGIFPLEEHSCKPNLIVNEIHYVMVSCKESYLRHLSPDQLIFIHTSNPF